MATSEIDKSNASGSSLTATNTTNYNVNSLADGTEEFTFNFQEKNAFSNNAQPLFYVIKRNEGDFSKTSPFLIQKAIHTIVGNQEI